MLPHHERPNLGNPLVRTSFGYFCPCLPPYRGNWRFSEPSSGEKGNPTYTWRRQGARAAERELTTTWQEQASTRRPTHIAEKSVTALTPDLHRPGPTRFGTNASAHTMVARWHLVVCTKPRCMLCRPGNHLIPSSKSRSHAHRCRPPRRSCSPRAPLTTF